MKKLSALWGRLTMSVLVISAQGATLTAEIIGQNPRINIPTITINDFGISETGYRIRIQIGANNGRDSIKEVVLFSNSDRA